MNIDSLNEHFRNPRNVGDLPAPDALGKAGSLTCGAILRVTLQINSEQRITDAKFKAAGCSLLVAACSLLTNAIVGKSTGEGAAFIQAKVEPAALNTPPSDKQHCPDLAREVILGAIRSYSDSLRAEWTGDDALICSCFGVSEQRIENAIARGHLRTVAEVTRVCNAGAGCGSCYKLIEDILDSSNEL